MIVGVRGRRPGQLDSCVRSPYDPPQESQADPAALVEEGSARAVGGLHAVSSHGQIGAADKAMVLNALKFLIAFYDAPAEYVRQRDDLRSTCDGC